MNIYEISYPGVLDEYPDYSVIRTAETAGKAKYEEYQSWDDAGGETTFTEYLRMIKVKKIGTSIPGPDPVPEEIQQRIDNVNALIREIGNRGRRFFYSKKHNRYIKLFWADGRIWLTQESRGRLVVLDKAIPDQHRHFMHGGTLWGLMCDFRDYINDEGANGKNGYGGLNSPHWGYPEEDMEAIREKARELGYLKVLVG